MFRCIFLRRKLYDYLDNSLSEIEKIRVEKHLESCPVCRGQLHNISRILGLAKAGKTPQPSEDFWHNFKIELDQKLNAKLVPEFNFNTRLSLRLKPALAYASVLLLILTVGIYFYRGSRSLTGSDLALISEINLLDEVTEESMLYGTEDYIDELSLFNRLESNSL